MLLLLSAILLSLLVIGLLSGLEIAFVSANRIALEVKRMEGSKAATFVTKYLSRPEILITCFLIAFNLCLAIITNLFHHAFAEFMHSSVALNLDPVSYFLLETLLLTSVIFFIGEIIPKIIFNKHSLYLLLRFVPVIAVILWIFKPVALLVTKLSHIILRRVFRVRRWADLRRDYTYTDLEEYVRMNTEEERQDNVINKPFLSNLIAFSTLPVRACMIHRNEIEAVSVKEKMSVITKRFIDTQLSRLVVYKDNLDNLVGYIHQLDVVRGKKKVADILIEIPAVPETMKARDLIRELSRQKKSMAWVVDEYGITAGVVTMENLLEEIFGELNDEPDSHELIERKISNKEYEFSGKISLTYLREKYHFDLYSEDVDTLSGLLIKANKVKPQEKELIKIGTYLFTIVQTSNTKIELVRVLIT